MKRAKSEANEPEIVIRRREVLDGLAEAAQRLCVSRSHLSYVVRGKRDSARMWERMKARNIRVAL